MAYFHKSPVFRAHVVWGILEEVNLGPAIQQPVLHLCHRLLPCAQPPLTKQQQRYDNFNFLPSSSQFSISATTFSLKHSHIYDSNTTTLGQLKFPRHPGASSSPLPQPAPMCTATFNIEMRQHQDNLNFLLSSSQFSISATTFSHVHSHL